MSVYDRFSEEELAILKQRAERVAHASRTEDTSDQFGALTIELQHGQYALPVEALTAVYENVTVVPVPCTPAYVKGITNIRGRIVPVLDMAVLLGVAESEKPDHPMMIVASHQDVTVAFQAAAVGDVVNISSRDIGIVPGNTEGRQTGFIQGILSDGRALLNVRTLLENSGDGFADGLRNP